MSLMESTLLLLSLSVAVVAVVRRLDLSPILGYLCVGFIAGPYGLGIISHSPDLNTLAELGIVFLLFTIGLELSLPKLIAIRHHVLFAGGTQVLICTIIPAIIAWQLGMSIQGAIIAGGALALSSTAIVSKSLLEQGQLYHPHGQLSLGILIFQDIAAVPFLIAIPVLAQSSQHGLALALGSAFLKALVAFTAVLLIARYVLRHIFHEVGKPPSSELFTFLVLLVALGAGWVTHAIGLSMTLGAFIAGVGLGETAYRHQIESDIQPFRDVLLGLFFITVGMLLNWSILATYWHWVLVLTMAIIIFKFFMITAIAHYLSNTNITESLQTGIILAHSGEFGFALLALAIQYRVIEPDYGQVVLAGVILTLFISPLLTNRHAKCAKKILNYLKIKPPTTSLFKSDLKNHVIICGYGRVGQGVAKLLEQQQILYIALDMDSRRISAALRIKAPVHYGDATKINMLMALGVKTARCVVISFDNPTIAQKITTQVRHIHPEIPVVIRTNDEFTFDQLSDAGASEIVSQTYETSIMLGVHALLHCDVPLKKALDSVWTMRSDRYQLLKKYIRSENIKNAAGSLKIP